MKTFTIEVPDDVIKIEINLVKPMKFMTESDKAERILKLIADYFNISVKQVKSSIKEEIPVKARQIFCDLSKQRVKLSNVNLGKIINRDHSTITHSRKTSVDRLLYDHDYAFDYNNLKTIVDTEINMI